MMSWLRCLLLTALSLCCSHGLAQGAPPPRSLPPLLVYTDIASGPNYGGENNKGIYLSLFGKNFGSARGLGSTTKVYIGAAEVDNYRYLGPAKGRQDIQQITVQVGSLGKPASAIALPIKVVVDGRPSNTNLAFTVNPGTIYFVSPVGSDRSGNGSFASPYRTVQTADVNNNGSPGCPAAQGRQSVEAVGVWGLVQPGDFMVMRGGTWTDISKDGFFLRAQNKSGSAPDGKAGSGPITLMGYPGEKVFIDRSDLVGDNQGGGGISSADSARQALGCGSWMTLTNLIVESGLNEGPINTQNATSNPAGSHWRVVNNEMTAISCKINTQCKGGGVSGSGVGNFWVGNHVHDVYDKPDCCTNFENHGFYIEGIGSYEVAYNRIENIAGGNGIQTFSSVGPDYRVNNASIHHNLIHLVGKHGINIGDGSAAGIFVFNNIVSGADMAALRFNSTSLIGAKIFNNTFYDADRLGHGYPRAALMNDAALGPGAVDFRNNIVVVGDGRSYLGGSVGFSAIAATLSNNLWFNGKGSAAGVHPIIADPRFISAGADFHLARDSPAVNAGSNSVASLVTNDFDIETLRPQGAGFDIGAYESRVAP